jgi:hypothetical protein
MDIKSHDLPDQVDEFMSLYPNCFNWSELFRSVRVSDQVIRKYHSRFNWPVILLYQRLSPPLLLEYLTELEHTYQGRLNHQTVTYSDDESETVNTIKRAEDRLLVSLNDRWICWQYVSEYQLLTPELVEKYADRLDWKLLTFNIRTNSYDTLGNTGFMLKHHDRLNWNDISRYFPFTETDLREVDQYLQFDDILRLRYHNISGMDSDFDTDYEDESDTDTTYDTRGEAFRNRGVEVYRSPNILVTSKFLHEYRHRFNVIQGNPLRPGVVSTKKINRTIRYLQVVLRMNRFRNLWKRYAYRVGGSMYKILYQNYQNHQVQSVKVLSLR